MERVVSVVEQLSEAGRFLRVDTLAYARMALLLLDNVAELLISRAVTVEIEHDDQWARIYNSARTSMPSEVADRFIKESGYELMSNKVKRATGRLFPPKVDLLVERGRLDATTGDVIKALHRYRNDAYHKDKVRREMIKAAATLYLEIDCGLLVSLPPYGMAYSSKDNWSDFMTRYGLKGSMIMVPGDLQTIATKLRQDMGIPATELAELLADHLESRLDSLYEQLEFISENVSSKKTTPEEELVRVQFWKERGPMPWDKVEREFRTFKAKCTEKDLSAWREEATLIRNDRIAPKLQLQKRFCEIEQLLEPIENMVDEVAFEIDHAIHLEVDRLRGK